MELGEARGASALHQVDNRPDVRELAPALRWMFHCPNGGKREAITGGQMRALGVKQGVPDLLMPVVSSPDCALVLEFKSATGRIGPD